jgi:hypothetical protein
VSLSAIFGELRPFRLVPLVGAGRTEWSRTAVSRGTTWAAFSRGYRYIVHFDGDNFVKGYSFTARTKLGRDRDSLDSAGNDVSNVPQLVGQFAPDRPG